MAKIFRSNMIVIIMVLVAAGTFSYAVYKKNNSKTFKKNHAISTGMADEKPVELLLDIFSKKLVTLGFWQVRS